MAATDTGQGSGQQRKGEKNKENGQAPDSATAPLSPPARQHNPGEKGVNPDQKGPVQPDNK